MINAGVVAAILLPHHRHWSSGF